MLVGKYRNEGMREKGCFYPDEMRYGINCYICVAIHAENESFDSALVFTCIPHTNALAKQGDQRAFHEVAASIISLQYYFNQRCKVHTSTPLNTGCTGIPVQALVQLKRARCSFPKKIMTERIKDRINRLSLIQTFSQQKYQFMYLVRPHELNTADRMRHMRENVLGCCLRCQRSFHLAALINPYIQPQGFFPFAGSGCGGAPLSLKGVAFNFSMIDESVVIFLPITTVLLHTNRRTSAKKKKLKSQIAFIHSMGSNPRYTVKRMRY
jgi:hypothetical protein